MEFGHVTHMRSKYLNENIVLYQSVSKPEHFYSISLFLTTAMSVVAVCPELGKIRVIRVKNEVVVGRKNPELDHHQSQVVPNQPRVRSAHHIRRGLQRNVYNITTQTGTKHVYCNITLTMLINIISAYFSTALTDAVDAFSKWNALFL